MAPVPTLFKFTDFEPLRYPVKAALILLACTALFTTFLGVSEKLKAADWLKCAAWFLAVELALSWVVFAVIV